VFISCSFDYLFVYILISSFLVVHFLVYIVTWSLELLKLGNLTYCFITAEVCASFSPGVSEEEQVITFFKTVNDSRKGLCIYW